MPWGTLRPGNTIRPPTTLRPRSIRWERITTYRLQHQQSGLGRYQSWARATYDNADLRDNMNRLTALTDPLGNVTTYMYNNDGQPHFKMVDAATGQITTYAYDSAPAGCSPRPILGAFATTLSYDPANRLRGVTEPLGIYHHNQLR